MCSMNNMKEEYDAHLKAIYIRTRETDDVFAYRGVASVDEIQPERKLRAKKVHAESIRGASGRFGGRKIFTRGATLGLLLLAFTFASGITATHQTLSYFNDIENTSGNNLNAGLLDFTVNAANYSGEVVVGETGITFDPVASGEAGSLQLEYRVHAEQMSGPESDAFCNALVAHAEGSLAYDGPLVSLAVGPTNSVGVYEVGITMPDATGVSNGDSCVIDLVYTGWYQHAPDEQGYMDEERVTLTLTANVPEQQQRLFEALNFFSAPEEGAVSPEEEPAEIPLTEEEGTPSEDEEVVEEEKSVEQPALPEPENVIPEIPEMPEVKTPEVLPVAENLIPEIPEVPEVETPEVPEVSETPEVPVVEESTPPAPEVPEIPAV